MVGNYYFDLNILRILPTCDNKKIWKLTIKTYNA